MTIKVGEGTHIGWIGAGRMGAALATRLLRARFDVAVYNRTKAKAEALAEHGATVVDRPAELADRDVVFSMVSTEASAQVRAEAPRSARNSWPHR